MTDTKINLPVRFPYLTEGETETTCHKIGTTGVGIDRLSISFPVRYYQHWSRWEQTSYRPGTGQQTATARVPLWEDNSDNRDTLQRVTAPKIMIGLTQIAGKHWAKAEANPSRFADPDGCTLMDPRLLGPAIEVMWRCARTLVEPDCDVLDASVTRVDVARDFRGITSPSLLVSGLGPIRRPWARRSFTYNDPGRAHAETLYVGSGAGGVRLYDQHQAYADKGAPEGSLRWEVEARKGWLGKVGIRHVTDLDPVSVGRLAADRWDWSAMGTPVTGPVHAVDVLRREVAAGHLKAATAARMLGSSVMHALGGPGVSTRTEYRYRRLARELGVGSAALWSDERVARVRARLDWESGTERVEEADG